MALSLSPPVGFLTSQARKGALKTRKGRVQRKIGQRFWAERAGFEFVALNHGLELTTWSGRPESNRRPPVPETGATIRLSYYQSPR